MAVEGKDVQASELVYQLIERFQSGEIRWIQHSTTDGRGGACLVGGVFKVASWYWVEKRQAEDALLAICRAIEAYSGTPVRATGWDPKFSTNIPGWNDTPGRTVDEVITVLEKARADLEEKGL